MVMLLWHPQCTSDRVGVPRDLPLPAARQLRAHLNWLIDTIGLTY